jgi:sulfur carrier protein
MRISLNGEAREVDARTLAEAMTALGFADVVVATAVNGRFVPATMRGNFELTEGDEIEVVAPMQGG